MQPNRTVVSDVFGVVIERIAGAARDMAGDAPYAVYVLIDETRPDPQGRFLGSPFYVGQTSNIYGRVRDHFCRSLVHSGPPGSVEREIERLTESGNPPRADILQTCLTKAQSRYAETCWVQFFLEQNFTMTNRCGLQAAPMTPVQWKNFERSATRKSAKCEIAFHLEKGRHG